MNSLAAMVGEKTLFGRVGGAPTLAVGMAKVFAGLFQGAGIALWYHFAIMFEALFILTTLDAGTRVGRYVLQDALRHVWAPLGDTKRTGPAWMASGVIVGAWGCFLIQGVRDPLGGINSLWPLFGIANQLLAAIALCLATTVILKMHLNPPPARAEETSSHGAKIKPGSPALALVTLIPLLWLLTVTMTAGLEKIFHPDPNIGFLSAAKDITDKLPSLRGKLELAQKAGDSAAVILAREALRAARANHFNLMLDAAVAGSFLAMVTMIAGLSLREWILLLARRKLASLRETAPIWLPDYAIAETKPWRLFNLLALGLLLLRELSGEADMDRAQHSSKACSRQEACRQVTEKRFSGVNRCC
jgi:carbon starvation protein